MSRKNYRAAAAVLSAAYTTYGVNNKATDALDQVTRGLAEMFKADNPRFSRDRFLAAVHDRSTEVADEQREQRDQEQEDAVNF